MKKKITISLDEETGRRLEFLQKALGATLSGNIRKAVEMYHARVSKFFHTDGKPKV